MHVFTICWAEEEHFQFYKINECFKSNLVNKIDHVEGNSELMCSQYVK